MMDWAEGWCSSGERVEGEVDRMVLVQEGLSLARARVCTLSTVRLSQYLAPTLRDIPPRGITSSLLLVAVI